MVDTLRIKRRTGGAPGAPAGLANAELAYNEVDHTLYYGEGTGGAGGTATVIVPIGGQGLGSVASPLMDGVAAPGSANTFSKGDHVHPTDTSRAPLASPAFTGAPTAPTVTPGTDNTTKIATTAFVQSAVSAVSSGVTNVTVQDGLSGGGTGNITIGISNNGIANAKLGTMAAHTYKGNNTGATATPIDVTAAQLLTDIGGQPSGSYAKISGTPSAAQLAQWTAADTIQGAALSTFSLSQWAVPTADVPWNSKKITGLLDPSNAQDAATKNYVDLIVQGIDALASVRLATTANLAALSGNLSVDGLTTVAGDRILVKNQTSSQNNGVYIASAGAWARSTDNDTWNELISAFVFVEAGTINADSGWLCTVDAGGTINTTPVTWVQFSGAGQITAGSGLTKTGNQLDVVGTTDRITANADSIDIASTYVGQATITTLGTVATGVWNATIITVAKGGTGVGTLTGYVKGAGTSNMTASATIPNTDITGLGTMSTQSAGAVAITGGAIDGITFDMGSF